MRASLLLGLSLCVAFPGAPVLAQGAVPTGVPRTNIEGIEIPAIPNAPFVARVEVTWTQPLDNGASVSRKYYTMVARDSKGRVHRETRGFVPANSSAEPPLRSIAIIDPVSSVRTTCAMAAMTCATSAFHPQLILPGAAATGMPDGQGDANRASLGTQTMDGLQVMGTRQTVNDPATGLATQTDAWISPELQMDLSVVRSSPRMGQVRLIVSDLVRGEPDPSWFATPSGFAITGAPNR